jgi:hypothetical protein
LNNEPKTITFRCPWCKNTCAFKDFNKGKSARCTDCQNHFVIPESDNAKPKKIKPQSLESDGDIISGFYPAALKKAWPLIFCKSSATGLVFVATLVVLKFIIFNFNFNFSVHIEATGKNIEIPIRIGNTIGTCAYALIFWYYMDIIYATAFGNDKFPTITLGLTVDIVCKIAKTLYLFVAAMTMAQLPTLTAMLIMNICQIKSTPTLIAIAVCCCFTFPMLVLMAAISQDLLSVLRLDLAIRAILNIFPQYCLAAAITAAVIIAATLSRNYHYNMTETPVLIPLYLMANILTALAGTYAARTLGLLYKHHGGQMPW